MTTEQRRESFPPQQSYIAFIVDRLGNVEAPESRAPQIIRHREQLNPQQRATSIDLDKVGNSSYTSAIYVVLQDFGLPFRTITINQMFIFEDDKGIAQETTSTGSKKAGKLSITCLSYGWNKSTEIYIDRKNFHERPVELASGQHVVFAHDGNSSDFRTGFIENDAHIVAFQDDWRKPEEAGHFDKYTPIVAIAYEGETLTITTYDDANAEVIFEKIVSQADTAVTTKPQVPPEVLGEEAYKEVIASLQNTLSSDQMKVLTGLVAELQILGAENDSLTRRVEVGKTHEQALEVALTRNKRLLIETQKRLQGVLFENERLKKQARGATQADPFSTFRSEGGRSDADPYGYCGVLGINPERLFGMSPQESEKVVIALRRVYASLYHPDINSQVNLETMKAINNAADRILNRIKTGSWGRN